MLLEADVALAEREMTRRADGHRWTAAAALVHALVAHQQEQALDPRLLLFLVVVVVVQVVGLVDNAHRRSQASGVGRTSGRVCSFFLFFFFLL